MFDNPIYLTKPIGNNIHHTPIPMFNIAKIQTKTFGIQENLDNK